MVSPFIRNSFFPLTIAILIIMMICRVEYVLLLNTVILSLLCGAALWRGAYRFSPIDLFIGALLLYDAILLFTSINPIPGYEYFANTFVAILFYIAIRVFATTEKRLRVMLLGLLALFSILQLVAIVSFFIFRQNAINAGCKSLYAYRALQAPLGYLINHWGTILVCFLCVWVLCLYLYRQKRYLTGVALTGVPILFGAITSFSRGVYISLGLVSILLLVALFRTKTFRLKQKYYLSALYLFTLFSIFIAFKQDAAQTVRFNETVSQRRSIDSRRSAWKIVKDQFAEFPVWGVGNGNYTLVVNADLFEDDNNSFTNFQMNSFYQLIVEKGVVGIIVWGALLLFLVLLFSKKYRSKSPLFVLLFLLIIGVREATFPSFFNYRSVQSIVFVLIAIGANYSLFSNNNPINRRTNRMLCLTIIGITTIISVCAYVGDKKESCNKRFIAALERGDLAAAEKQMDSAGNNLPYIINKSILYEEKFNREGGTENIAKAQKYIQKAIEINPKDVMQEYRSARLFYTAGKNDEAEKMISDLSIRFPNKAIFQLEMFYAMCRKDRIDEAITHLAKTVELIPSITESPFWAMISYNYPDIASSVKERIVSNAKSNFNALKTDPIVLAKYGQLMFSFGDYREADKYLSEAVNQLPNMAYPWYYLGRIASKSNDREKTNLCMRRFAFLYGVEFTPQTNLAVFHKVVMSNRSTPEEALLKTDIYSKKFKLWYKSIPASIYRNILYSAHLFNPHPPFSSICDLESLKSAYAVAGDSLAYAATDFIIRNNLSSPPSVAQIKNHIDYCIFVWKTNPYKESSSFDDFCKYILPYESKGKNYLDRKDVFYDDLCLLRSLDSCLSVFKAIDTIRYRYKNIAYSDKIEQTNDVASFLAYGKANCYTMTEFNEQLFSSLGFTVTTDCITQWANATSAHAWSVLLYNEKYYPFDAFYSSTPEEAWAGDNLFNNEYENIMMGKKRLPKVFRKQYLSNTTDLIANEKANPIPIFFQNTNMADVSNCYFATQDITIEIPDSISASFDYVWLSTFNNKSFVPAFWAKIELGKATFKDMGMDILYFPGGYKNGTIHHFGNPVYCDKKGVTHEFKHSENETETISLKRKYPFININSDLYCRALKGTSLYGLKERKTTLLGVISDSITALQDTIELNSTSPFYEFILSIPYSNFGQYYPEIENRDIRTIADVDLYTKNNNNQLIVVKPNYDPEYDAIFDNNTLTVFTPPNKDTIKIKMWFDTLTSIYAINLTPKNDKNYIYKEYSYELMMWSNSRWVTIGKKNAHSNSIEFDAVPKNAVLRLNCKTEGSEERVFRYRNGLQEWF